MVNTPSYHTINVKPDYILAFTSMLFIHIFFILLVGLLSFELEELLVFLINYIGDKLQLLLGKSLFHICL